MIPQDTVAQNPSATPVIPQANPNAAPLFKELGIVDGRSLGWIPDPALAQDSRFGLYKFGFTSKENLDVCFWYLKPKTLDEANTPFRTYTEFKNHHWPKVLQALAIVQDYTFPNVTNVISGDDTGIVTAPMNYGKYALVDDVDEGTRFVTEEFFGPIPYAIPRYAVPVTSPVHVEVLGVNYDFPNCLHPKIQVPNTRTGDAMLVAGSAAGVGGALNGQLFPATNFETWAPYVLTDQQEQRAGGWYRIRVRVYPPDLPETNIGNT